MPFLSNRAVATALCAGVLSLVAASGAHAQFTNLPNNSFINVVNGVPAENPATFVTSLSSPFAGVNGNQHLSGTLVSAVYNVGVNVRDFVYQLTVNPSGPTSDSSSTGINIASFFGFTTDVGQVADGDGAGAVFITGTDQAVSAQRSNDGEGVQFNYSAPLGTTTFSFIVRTNATNQVTGNAGVLASGVSANAQALAPALPGTAGAPEPGSIALTAFGMIGMIGGVAARRKKSA